MKWHYGLKLVLSQRRYLALLIAVSAIFTAVYIFAWNLVLWRDMYVRYDLWTLPNVLLLAIISVLSGMTFTLALHNMRMSMSFHKKSYGFLAVFPSFFTSMCPGCAPLVLSFSSASFAAGLALTRLSIYIDAIIVIILLATLYSLSSSTGSCKIKAKR